MVNKDAINQVIASIKGESARTATIGFNMDNFLSKQGNSSDQTGRGCGTVACIAGHAYLLAGGKVSDSVLRGDIANRAMEFLGLEYDAADNLFYGYVDRKRIGPSHVDLSEVSPEQAIGVLETLRDTGIVDWEPVYKQQRGG